MVEGLDGAGKSTTAKALAHALKGVFLSTPLDEFNVARFELEKIYDAEPIARQLFYASTAVCSSNRVMAELKKHDYVVIDRYWLSTQVYHSWRTSGKHLLLSEVEETILKPDITIYLSLTLEDRVKRLGERDNNTKEDSLTMDVVANHKLNELYRSYADTHLVGKWIEVDASRSTKLILEEVLKQI